MSSHYDVVICGGGPAGLACALTARRLHPILSVAVLEAGTYPRHKVCGEFFSAEATALLTNLLGAEHRLLSSTPLDTVVMNNGSKSFRVKLPKPALSISRYDLDFALWQQASSEGVECISGTRVLSVAHNCIRTEAGVISADAVVNAAGRWSGLNRKLSLSSRPTSKRIGIKAHFWGTMPEESVCEIRFFDQGYVGVQSVGNGMLNVSALVDAKLFRTIDSVLAAAGIRDDSWKLVEPPITCPPVRFHAPQPVREGILQCGDAAGFIDPFTGDGMSLAVHSGVLAGECVTLPNGAATYSSAYKRRFGKAFRNASLLRKLVFGPEWMQSAGISMMQIPPVARFAFASTRAS